jgi:hypothetical protein
MQICKKYIWKMYMYYIWVYFYTVLQCVKDFCVVRNIVLQHLIVCRHLFRFQSSQFMFISEIFIQFCVISFQIFIAVTVHIVVFWAVTPCSCRKIQLFRRNMLPPSSGLSMCRVRNQLGYIDRLQEGWSLTPTGEGEEMEPDLDQ